MDFCNWDFDCPREHEHYSLFEDGQNMASIMPNEYVYLLVADQGRASTLCLRNQLTIRLRCVSSASSEAFGFSYAIFSSGPVDCTWNKLEL
jgi:hypothetical protein